MYGINATDEFWMRGKQGEGTKKTRRLFSNGPVGAVMEEAYGLSGFLRMRFYCKDLLLFVGDEDGLRSSTMQYLMKNAAHHLKNPTLTDVVALRSMLCETEIEDDVLLALIDYSSSRFPGGAAYFVVSGLVFIDRVAQARGWRSVDKNNWGTQSFLPTLVETLSFPIRIIVE